MKNNNRKIQSNSIRNKDLFKHLLHVIRQNNLSQAKEIIDQLTASNYRDENDTTVLHIVAGFPEPAPIKNNLIKYILNKGADPNSQDKMGISPLEIAFYSKDIESIKILCDARANVDIMNENGETLLFKAIKNKYPREIIKFFIENTQHCNKADARGWTPLLSAVAACALLGTNAESAYKYYFAIIKDLLAAGANVNAISSFASVHHAARSNNAQVLQELINAGADLNIKDRDINLDTPLLNSIRNSALKTFNILMARESVLVTLADKNNTTPLHCAAQLENPLFAETLLQREVDINAKDVGGRTPLMYAANKNKHKIIKALIDAGAIVDATDNQGNTALFYLLKNETGLSSLLYFILAKANINHINNHGTSFLDEVIKEGDKKFIEYVMRVGKPTLNHNIKHPLTRAVFLDRSKEIIDDLISISTIQEPIFNPIKELPILIGTMNRNKPMDIIPFLITQGASLSVKDKNGNSLFHLAVIKNHIDVVEYLLQFEQDIDINCRNNDDHSSLICAIKDNRIDIIKIFYAKYQNNNMLRAISEEVIFYSILYCNDFSFSLFIKHSPIFLLDEQFKNNLQIQTFLKTRIHNLNEVKIANNYIQAKIENNDLVFSVKGEGDYIEKKKQKYSRAEIYQKLKQLLLEYNINFEFNESSTYYMQTEDYALRLVSCSSLVISRQIWKEMLQSIKSIQPTATLAPVSSSDVLTHQFEPSIELNKINVKLIRLTEIIISLNQAWRRNIDFFAQLKKHITDMMDENVNFKNGYNELYQPGETAIQDELDAIQLKEELLKQQKNIIENEFNVISNTSNSVSVETLNQINTKIDQLQHEIYQELDNQDKIKTDINRFFQYVFEYNNEFYEQNQFYTDESQEDEFIKKEYEISNLSILPPEPEMIIISDAEQKEPINNECETAVLQRIMRKFTEDELNRIEYHVGILSTYNQNKIELLQNEYFFPAILYALFNFTKELSDTIYKYDKNLREKHEDINYLRWLRNLHRHYNIHGSYPEAHELVHTDFMENLSLFISPFVFYFKNGKQFDTPSILIKGIQIEHFIVPKFTNHANKNEHAYLALLNAQKTLDFALNKLENIAILCFDNMSQMLKDAARMMILLISDSFKELKKQFYSTYKEKIEQKQELIYFNKFRIPITWLEHYANKLSHEPTNVKKIPDNLGEFSTDDNILNKILQTCSSYKQIFIDVLNIDDKHSNIIALNMGNVEKPLSDINSSFSYNKDIFSFYGSKNGNKIVSANAQVVTPHMENNPKNYSNMGSYNK